jgi:LEM3 (ligand-effect modulator 3) family / CDC50 family
VPHFNYRLRSSESGAQFAPPQYAFISASSNTSSPQCIVQFDIPFNITPTVLLYYKLTNFYQNHRRYVQSYDPKQLVGEHRTFNELKNGNCKPVATDGDQIIYPCGLIANSIFNGMPIACRLPDARLTRSTDTYTNLTNLNPPSGASSTYSFSETGIAWHNEGKKYAETPGYNLSEIVPPPNWALKFPNGYTTDQPPPNLRADEHFQNWMRTAGLPTFTKLYGRNDNDELIKGRYEITIEMSRYPSA